MPDSNNNTYRLAIGPTSGTGQRQSIYYGANIKGGSNKVTVRFNQTAQYADVRVLEYQGVNAVDVTVAASGNSGTASSGAATTTAPNELIFGAATVATAVTGGGSGFTSEVITPYGDNAEDRVVTKTGNYSATGAGESFGYLGDANGDIQMNGAIGARAAVQVSGAACSTLATPFRR